MVRIFPKRYSLVTASAASTRITAEANCRPARVKKIALPSSDWDVINTPKAIGMSTARPMHHQGERVERNLIHSDRAMLITPGRLIADGVGGVLKVAAGSSLLACSVVRCWWRCS